jgi:hypothetical protein
LRSDPSRRPNVTYVAIVFAITLFMLDRTWTLTDLARRSR